MSQKIHFFNMKNTEKLNWISKSNFCVKMLKKHVNIRVPRYGKPRAIHPGGICVPSPYIFPSLSGSVECGLSCVVRRTEELVNIFTAHRPGVWNSAAPHFKCLLVLFLHAGPLQQIALCIVHCT